LVGWADLILVCVSSLRVVGLRRTTGGVGVGECGHYLGELTGIIWLENHMESVVMNYSVP